jgi:2-keto-3-deoxy-L-rhamnonate aldolase RhmA
MIKSRVLAKLRKGDFVRVANISRVIDPSLTELIGRLGFDVIWFDMEHRSFGYVIDPLSLACRATGMDLMVRVLKTGYSSPMRCLEFGANGLMVPHVRSVEEARQ